MRTMNTKMTLTIMMLNNNDDADNVNDDADWWQGGWWWWWQKITSFTCQLSWSLPQAVSISLSKKASSKAPSWSSAPCACSSPTCSASPSPASSSTRSLLSVWESEWGAFHVDQNKDKSSSQNCWWLVKLSPEYVLELHELSLLCFETGVEASQLVVELESHICKE